MPESSPFEIPDFLKPDTRFTVGQHKFSSTDIKKFGEKFDPQPFHTDETAARDSMLGGLCASGWHTVSTWMRLQREFTADNIARLKAANQPYPEFGPSPGLKFLKWIRPVFADDTVTYANTGIEIRKSKSKPDWWVYTYKTEGLNQNSLSVIEFQSTVFLKIHHKS
ncbi:MAG: MaoC family dehydratase [Pseudomonadota bacterium]